MSEVQICESNVEGERMADLIDIEIVRNILDNNKFTPARRKKIFGYGSGLDVITNMTGEEIVEKWRKYVDKPKYGDFITYSGKFKPPSDGIFLWEGGDLYYVIESDTKCLIVLTKDHDLTKTGECADISRLFEKDKKRISSLDNIITYSYHESMREQEFVPGDIVHVYSHNYQYYKFDAVFLSYKDYPDSFVVMSPDEGCTSPQILPKDTFNLAKTGHNIKLDKLTQLILDHIDAKNKESEA